MPMRPQDNLVFPASPAQVLAGVEKYRAITPHAARGVLWVHGECRLIKNGANLMLVRLGLGRMILGNVLYQIPLAGVLLAPTAQVPGTLYYVYLTASSGVLALETSTTGYAVDSATGFLAKSGDPSRILVGMALPGPGPAWVDSQRERCVVSYHNRRRRTIRSSITVARDVASTSFANILTADETPTFLTWADEPVQLGLTATGQHVTGNTGVSVGLSIDGSGLGVIAAGAGSSVGEPFGLAIPEQGWNVSEGAHAVGLPALCVSSQGLIRSGAALSGIVMG